MFNDIFTRLDTIHERDGQTDGGHWLTAKTALRHIVAWWKLILRNQIFMKLYEMVGHNPGTID